MPISLTGQTAILLRRAVRIKNAAPGKSAGGIVPLVWRNRAGQQCFPARIMPIAYSSAAAAVVIPFFCARSMIFSVVL